MAQDPETQQIYDELKRRGVFHQDAEAQQIGHELRARGVVSDPTQGGLVRPAAPAAPNLGGPADPYGSPTALPPGVAPRPLPAPAYNDNNYAPGIKAPVRPAPHPAGNYFTNTVAPDARRALLGLKGLADTLTQPMMDLMGAGGDRIDQITTRDPRAKALAGGSALTNMAALKPDARRAAVAAGQAADPRTFARQPLVRDGVTVAGGLLKALDTRGGYTESPAAQVLRGVRGAAQDAHDFPVQSALAVAPFVFDGLHGAFRDPLTGMDLNPSAGQFPELRPAPPELHPKAPVGPNNTMRAASGQLVSPKAVRPTAARPLPTPAAVMDSIARGAEAAAPKPVPAPSPVEAATATARQIVSSVAAHGGSVDPAELHGVLKTYHPALTDGEAAGVVKSVVPPETPAPVQNAPQEAVGATEAGAAAPAAVPGPSVPHPDAVEAQALAPAQAAPEVPKAAPKAAPDMAGSINLDRMGISDDAKQVIRDATERLHAATPGGPPTLGHADALDAANALGLTPELARQIPLGESPSGVHPGIYNLALRNLVAKQSEALRTIAPDDPARPALQAANDDLVNRTGALSRGAGQQLSLHNAIASPIEEAVQQAQSKMQALSQTPSLSDLNQPGPTIRVTTRAKTYGTANKVITSEAKDAALARIRAAGGRLNSGVDPGLFKDLATLGAFHVEAGLRKFADWSVQMAKDVPHFGGMDAGGQQQVYAASRAQYAEGLNNSLKQTGQLVFADALAPRLGRQGASDYINQIADGPHPDLLRKLLTGDPSKLTPAEKQFANDAMRDNSPAKGKGVSQASLSAVKAISKEFADRNRRAALQQARAARKAASPAKPPRAAPDAVTKTVLGRLGKVNGPEFFSRLAADPATAGTLGKLQSGQELTLGEQRAVAAHLEDLKPVKAAAQASDASKQLTQIVRDAKGGKLGFDDAKAVVQHELTQSAEPGQIGAANAELSGVTAGDTNELARIHAKYSPSPLTDKLIFGLRSGLLSGPLTLKGIIASHLLGATVEDTATRAAASAVDPFFGWLLNDTGPRTTEGLNLKATGQAAMAGVKALPEGLRVLRHGETALQLEGMAPSFQYEEGHHGLQVEPLNASNVGEHGRKLGARLGPAGAKVGQGVGRAVGGAVAFFPRTHGAVFHVIGKALFERGRIEAATLKAKAQGGDPMKYRSDPDVLKSAAAYRKEQLYTNKNTASQGLSALGRFSGPVGNFVVRSNMPFNRVPMNLAMRGLEYTGAGGPIALARALGVRAKGIDFATGKEVTPAEVGEFRRSVSRQAGRGIAGLGLGVTGGAALTAAGILTPPNAKEHESGHLNLFGHSFDTSRFEPVINAPNFGGEIVNRAQGKPADFLSPLTKNPYFSAIQNIENLNEAANGKPGTVERFAGRMIAEYIPTLLSQIASTTDPSGETRKQKALVDYLMNRVPGLREKLPTTGRPQASNIKAVGAPLALLSPVGVEPRDGQQGGSHSGGGGLYGRPRLGGLYGRGGR